jgi:hypothetical protein
MNSKTTTYVLVVLLIAALAFALYSHNRASTLVQEKGVLESKYEEAIIDAEKAAQRIELMREDLEKALEEAELHRKQAEEALAELQKHKR